MRSPNLIAIILAFLALLLVLASAVVFLSTRNRELDQQITEFSNDNEALEVTQSRLESDLVVIESAYESSGATREAAGNQVQSSEATLEAVMSSVTPVMPTPTTTAVVEQDPVPRLIIFAPSDGAVVRPLETITLYMAAHALNGVDRIELVIDDGKPVIYPAGGLITFTLPVRWEVPSEGAHSIRATATGVDDISSQAVFIVVDAAYQSDEDRAATMRDMQLADLALVRFPGPAGESLSPQTGSSTESNLHLQMLTGWDAYDEQGVLSRTMALQAFNFLPSGYNLDDYYQSIEGVILVYNKPESGYPITVDAIEDEGSFARWIAAHDLAHQLQDGSFQLAMFDFSALDSDARTSLRAMIEGEGAFLQSLYFESESFDNTERERIEDELDSMGPTKLDTLPMFLRKDFEFAFSEGYAFTQYLYDQGGITALDAVWRNPPQSSEQILHPERYLSKDMPRHPQLLVLDEVLGEGWRMIDEDTLGEFYLREYLAQAVPPELAEAAAFGWGGGKYALYADEASNSSLLVLRLAWDTPAEREEFEAVYSTFADRHTATEGFLGADGGICWEQNDVICLYQIDEDSLIIQSPDLVTAKTISSSIIVP